MDTPHNIIFPSEGLKRRKTTKRLRSQPIWIEQSRLSVTGHSGVGHHRPDSAGGLLSPGIPQSLSDGSIRTLWDERSAERRCHADSTKSAELAQREEN